MSGGSGGVAGTSSGGTGGKNNFACTPTSGMTCCATTNATVSWQAATNKCASLGLPKGHLVKVGDSNKNAAVTSALSGKNGWLGLSDSASEGT
ncbi:MAG: hypothetical protein U0263_40790, partial [Polyangiaceae bacterium]